MLEEGLRKRKNEKTETKLEKLVEETERGQNLKN